MNIAIRMLKVSTFILWAVIIFFSVTSVYSVMNLGVNVGEVQMHPSSNGVTLALPFSIDNSGYYEIADLNLTTRATDPSGTVLDLTETFVSSIPQGTIINASHKIEIGLDDIMALDYTSLLLEDSEFNVEIFAALNFARAVPVQLSTSTTIPWGAPLANFFVGDISVDNIANGEASMRLSFENHAILDLEGTLKLEVYAAGSSQDLVASSVTGISVRSGQSFDQRIYVNVNPQDALKLTSGARVHVVFETPMFTVEWDEQYG
ncbi:MAG: hypothetical protein NWF06_09860 [Candidatus Bathyarchaeota archaeon]|nr:hypothetical protein [Candidatus Bathyarchaeum sp.]